MYFLPKFHDSGFILMCPVIPCLFKGHFKHAGILIEIFFIRMQKKQAFRLLMYLIPQCSNCAAAFSSQDVMAICCGHAFSHCRQWMQSLARP